MKGNNNNIDLMIYDDDEDDDENNKNDDYGDAMLYERPKGEQDDKEVGNPGTSWW
jgi:hypothetical protein